MSLIPLTAFNADHEQLTVTDAQTRTSDSQAQTTDKRDIEAEAQARSLKEWS